MYWDDLFGFLFLMTYVWARGPGPFETFLATMFVNFGGIIHCAISANFTIFEVTSRRADKQRLWDVCDRKKGSFHPKFCSCAKKRHTFRWLFSCFERKHLWDFKMVKLMKLWLHVLRLPDRLSSHPACFPSSKVARVTETKGVCEKQILQEIPIQYIRPCLMSKFSQIITSFTDFVLCPKVDNAVGTIMIFF